MPGLNVAITPTELVEIHTPGGVITLTFTKTLTNGKVRRRMMIKAPLSYEICIKKVATTGKEKP